MQSHNRRILTMVFYYSGILFDHKAMVCAICRQTLSSDWYRPYGPTEKRFNLAPLSTLLYLSDRKRLSVIGSGTAKKAQNYKTREKLFSGNAEK